MYFAIWFLARLCPKSGRVAQGSQQTLQRRARNVRVSVGDGYQAQRESPVQRVYRTKAKALSKVRAGLGYLAARRYRAAPRPVGGQCYPSADTRGLARLVPQGHARGDGPMFEGPVVPGARAEGTRPHYAPGSRSGPGRATYTAAAGLQWQETGRGRKDADGTLPWAVLRSIVPSCLSWDLPRSLTKSS